MCPALVHAAAFEKSITRIALVGAPVSYRSIVMNEFYEFGPLCHVAGALTAYDLPDLVASIAPRKTALIALNDGRKVPATQSLINEELSFPRLVFSARGAPGNLRVLESMMEAESLIYWWLE